MHGPSGSISVRKTPFLGLLCQLCRSNALGTWNDSLLCCFFFIACFANGRFAYLHQLNISYISRTQHTQANKASFSISIHDNDIQSLRTKRNTNLFACKWMTHIYFLPLTKESLLVVAFFLRDIKAILKLFTTPDRERKIYATPRQTISVHGQWSRWLFRTHRS